MSKARKKSRAPARRQANRLIPYLAWGGGGLLLAALLGVAVWSASRPQAEIGEVVPVDSTQHVPENTRPGPYRSDPPAGGVHFEGTFPAKFYQESDLASLPPYPEGYLVHNLEHGYVVFWYNCGVISSEQCQTLKQSIQQVMDEFDGVKLIAFPWESIKEPLVMTSWGRLLRFQSVDVELMRNFVRANRNKAPEPNAP
jgi:hypothetical protein